MKITRSLIIAAGLVTLGVTSIGSFESARIAHQGASQRLDTDGVRLILETGEDARLLQPVRMPRQGQ